MRRTKIRFDPEHLPKSLRRFIDAADVYDSSCSDDAKVYYIDRDGGCFLKIAPEGSLETEAAMTAYFHSLGLSAEVLSYCTAGEKDYLITRRIKGEDCLDPLYLADPKRLCDTTATLLRQLHETDAADCPIRDRIETYTANVCRGFDGKHYEPELFQGLWEFSSFEEALKVAEDGLRALRADTLIHGDYCLPNILLSDWRLAGFIDLGSSGISDRHIDILWGIWTLKYNLGTTALTDRFLDAYGRDRIDIEKLRLIAAMEMIGS